MGILTLTTLPLTNVREFAIRVYTNPKKGGSRAWQKRLFVTARI
jgi:hypothetical protein